MKYVYEKTKYGYGGGDYAQSALIRLRCQYQSVSIRTDSG